MKNSLFKLFASVSIFASLFAVNVQALGVEEGNNSASESVTVGSVQTPVYSVDISWGDFSYDWAYQASTGEYGWQSAKKDLCVPVAKAGEVNDEPMAVLFDESGYMSAVSEGKIYSESSCSTSTNSVAFADISTTPVYTKSSTTGTPIIRIEEAATSGPLGQIVPSISWTPSSGYDWVTGNFNYTKCDFDCVSIDSEESFNSAYEIYTDSACSAYASKDNASYQANTYFTKVGGCATESIEGGVIPEEAIAGMGGTADGAVMRMYELQFEIGVDSNKTVTTPKANDTIGTITVSIASKE